MNINLAQLIKPKSINEIAGQRHLLSDNGILKKLIKTNTQFNFIFFGVPGSGKSMLAQCLSNDLKRNYCIFNAALDNKEKLKKCIDLCEKENRVLIIDECHRLNVDKQDVLLSYMDEKTFSTILITTENPYFVVNPAIRSRSQIIELKQLTNNEILEYVLFNIKKHDLKNLSGEVLNAIILKSCGDIRTILNMLDIINNLYYEDRISLKLLNEIFDQSIYVSGGSNEEHYNILSALHKSIRGSDPDAAIYYAARLIHIGDLKSLARRLIACVYEDISLANPSLCLKVVEGCNAALSVGTYECKQIFATIIIEMCLSPKSNSAYLAMAEALNDINNGKIYSVPNHIKDQSYHSASKLGIKGYKYPHDYPNSFVEQQYLPTELNNKKYYLAKKSLYEAKLNDYITKLKNKKQLL